MDITLDLAVKNRLHRDSLVGCLRALDKRLQIHTLEPPHCLDDGSLPHSSADVILIDTELDVDLAWTRQLKRTVAAPKIIFYMPTYIDTKVRDCINAGVEGLVSANDSVEALHHCIATVIGGRLCYPVESSSLFTINSEPATARPLKRGVDIQLTQRQRKVVQLIESGFSNKEIARELDIQVSTVKNHVHQILERLHVKSRCEAAAFYRRHASTQVSNY